MTTIEMKRSPLNLVFLLLAGASLALGGMVVGARFLAPSASEGLQASNWPLRGDVSPDQSAMPRPIRASGKRDKLPLVRARRVQEAIKVGDFGIAMAISQDTLMASRAKIWTFYPFKDFIKNIADLSDPNFDRHLSAWVDHAPLNPIPRLVRAQYYLDLAWHRRGHRFESETDKAAQEAFVSLLGKGLTDVRFALTLDPQSAYGLSLQVELLRGFGATAQMENALEQAVAIYPNYLPVYNIALSSLQPKWGGSVDRMYAFVDHFSSNAPAGSPLKLLPLNLYLYLMNAAGVDCTRQHGDEYIACFTAAMNRNVRPGLETEISSALAQFGESNSYETNQAISYLIGAMIEQAGGAAYSGQILQMAANSYHSDPRLIEDKGAENSYIIDQLVAKSWLYKGFYDNAITKYKEALSHLNAANFPSPEEKDLAVAQIYQTLTQMYSKAKRPSDMAAAAKAALSLDEDAGSRLYLCYGYHLMTRYTEAIKECSKILSDPQNGVNAYYWRGLSYKELHDDENAIGDLGEVASSQNGHRAGAAIALSMIYFGKNDNEGALGVLNRYAYLYDSRLTDEDDIAVAYNNRCFAYMELGDNQKALDDCNASLQHGSIPDALKKKQELLARLSH